MAVNTALPQHSPCFWRGTRPYALSRSTKHAWCVDIFGILPRFLENLPQSENFVCSVWFKCGLTQLTLLAKRFTCNRCNAENSHNLDVNHFGIQAQSQVARKCPRSCGPGNHFNAWVFVEREIDDDGRVDNVLVILKINTFAAARMLPCCLSQCIKRISATGQRGTKTSNSVFAVLVRQMLKTVATRMNFPLAT